MSTHCESECDCDYPSIEGGFTHAPHCNSRQQCDEGRYCDKHFEEAAQNFVYLRGVPRHTVFNDAQAIEERNQELRDAGRGHLVSP